MADPKNTNDIEMGDEAPKEAPKINNYVNDVKNPEPPVEKPQPQVNPTAAPTPKTEPERPVTGTQTIGQVRSQILQKPAPNPAARKKAVIGCLGAFGSIMLIFLVLAFVFIGGADSTANSPIARLLGLNQGSFINGLITLIHITFLLIALAAFVFTMVGLFKASMAKKDDKIAKKEGLRMSLVSGSILAFILIIWLFVYIYLDSKRVNVGPDVKDPIVTEPEDTLNLSAPVEIRFDASNVPINKTKFQIISYDWDFGDDSSGTSQIVTHIYEEKGRYDVVLTITKRDKKTGEETQDQYSKIVSIQNEKLTAIIKADPDSGEAPLKVTLDGSQSADPDGTIDRYEWDLDEDGEFDDAEGETVEFTFKKIGKYTVSLRVISTTEEFDIAEKEIVVGETITPEAKITIVDEPEEFVTGVSYLFKADSSTSPNGKIEKYEWNFGDGTKIEKTKSVSHTFKNEGTYEITLKVVDEEDEEGEITKKINVGGPEGIPKAKFTTTPAAANGQLAGTVPFTVVFNASTSSDTDNNIVEYRWDFNGDGQLDDSGEVLSHTFSKEGTYDVTLTVIDADDNEGKSTLIVKVGDPGISAAVSADKIEGSVPLTVTFDASGSSFSKGSITSYKWDFGDGTAPKLGAATISHKYTSIGSYKAKVTVIGSDNSQDTAEILINVREIALSACFKAALQGKAPFESLFDPGCSSGTIASYFWDFGDGSSSTQVKPSHTFSSPGTYTVTLEISDSDNTISSTKQVVTVE